MHEKAVSVLRDAVTNFRMQPDGPADISVIRRDLYSELYRLCAALGLRIQAPREGEAGALVALNPVRTAYPQAQKFDIAILDPEASVPEGAPETFWNLPLSMAVNVHLCDADNKPEKFYRSLAADLRKFREYAASPDSAPDFCGVTVLLSEAPLPSLPAAGLSIPGPGAWCWIAGQTGEASVDEAFLTAP